LLSFGGNNVYYMVSLRRRRSGDDLATISPLVSPTDCDASATPNGIPDCGVLIERVVEKGDSNIDDVTTGSCAGGATCPRWVNLLGKAAVYDPTRPMNSLWHGGDTYRSSTYGAPSAASDNINIAVSRIGGGTAPLDPDHYKVTISYGEGGAAPDVGLEGWLQPPGNTYETTDIWIDSPLNGYASPPDTDPCSPPASNGCHYRYGIHSDLLGGTVPIGNGDNPAVGQVNRIYARIRNYGTQPAVNATVFFDVTDPLGVGINGSNGFKQLGSVDVASIPPGGHVDVYLEWTPNVILTKQQIADGQFHFHSCIRVRVSHVAGETYFGNQDGNGQQENIDYFDATGAGGGGGAPGPANQTVIHLRNDSPSEPKQFMLGVLRDTLPPGWDVTVNNGDPVVELAPGAEQDIPVSIKQNVTEAIGTTHQIRIIASSQVTFTNPDHPTPHNEARGLGGVTFQVSVLSKTAVNCRVQGGVVTGQITGLDSRDATKGAQVAVVSALPSQGGGVVILPNHLVLVPVKLGNFTTPWPYGHGVCLYTGSLYSSASGSALF